MDKQALLQQKLQELKGEMVDALPGRIDRIRELWDQYSGHKAEHGGLTELQREVHSLKGASGSFGLDGVFLRAELLEQALNATSIDRDAAGACLEALMIETQRLS